MDDKKLSLCKVAKQRRRLLQHWWFIYESGCLGKVLTRQGTRARSEPFKKFAGCRLYMKIVVICKDCRPRKGTKCVRAFSHALDTAITHQCDAPDAPHDSILSRDQPSSGFQKSNIILWAKMTRRKDPLKLAERNMSKKKGQKDGQPRGLN